MILSLNERVIDLNTLSVLQRVIRELLKSAQPNSVMAGQLIVQ